MASTDNVLKTFSCKVELSKETTQAHPHLKDKMVVDLINGLEVVGDHIKVSESRHNLLNRFVDGVTGKGKQRQDLINKNLVEGLKTASIWLQKHESDFIQVNLALGTIGNKLLETRKGVMQVDFKVEALKDYVLDFEKVMKEKQQELGDYIKCVDIRTRADAQMDREIDSWKAGNLKHLPLPLQVFTVLDNLRNGSFALFMQKKATTTERNTYVEHLRSKIRLAVANDLGEKPDDMLFKQTWFNLYDLSHELDPIEKASLTYLSSWADKREQTAVFSVHSMLEEPNDRLPQRHNMLRWMDRNIEEQIGMIRT